MKTQIIKIAIPPYNCHSCIAQRKKWLINYLDTHNINLDCKLVFIGGDCNSKEFNDKVKEKLNKVLRDYANQ